MLCVTIYPPFKDWFFEKFSEWEKAQPKRRSTYTDFADFLSKNSFGLKVRQQYVSRWIEGMEPSEKYIPALAELLGNEVYEILGYERPNPYLNTINKLWERLTPDHQRRLAEDAARYESQNANTKTAHRGRKTTHDP